MVQLRTIILLLATLVASSVGLPSSNYRYIKELSETTSRSSPQMLSAEEAQHGVTPVPASWYHDQLVDHFNGQDKRTWSQRYFVNDTFWNPEDGAVFLCVGGEGPPLTGDVVVASVHCNDMVELAPKENALLIALEHRYYGESLPVEDFTTENLRYLSAHQALADLARFHGFIVDTWKLKPSTKWVSFGGSYPGMLAGWFRLKFPHLIHAAVSSSSPTRAQLNFQGYNDVVARSMADKKVGGSQECLDAITDGHKTVGDMLKSENGQNKLGSMFNICESGALSSRDNQADWAGNGVVYLPAQENDPSCTTPVCNIQKICKVMTDQSLGEPVNRLAQLSAIQNNNECVSVDHDSYVTSLQNTTIEGGVGRIWFYQTCTEFAFYQTCDENTLCPYTRGLNDLESSLDLCKQAFDLAPDQDTIDASNDYWGADKPQGSRILFPNGSIDPWHYLGVLEQPAPLEPTLWVDGASHHFWTHPSLPTDSAEVVMAREIIWTTVQAWLKEQ